MPETALDQDVVDLSEPANRNARPAHLHTGAGDGIQHPCGDHHDLAGLDLDPNDAASDAFFAALLPKTSTMKGMPPVMKLYELPDMGRMTLRLLSAASHGSSQAQIAAPIAAPSC
ncbi:hypothetical protein VQ042_24625 [Aurantimonas sp. A2-1-M11]|uniref:hypothetical protein n=1 Tax=Aurantimonas sp. A2-1-M11 TaxID=3113712 RepID=UPI002F951999